MYKNVLHETKPTTGKVNWKISMVKDGTLKRRETERKEKSFHRWKGWKKRRRNVQWKHGQTVSTIDHFLLPLVSLLATVISPRVRVASESSSETWTHFFNCFNAHVIKCNLRWYKCLSPFSLSFRVQFFYSLFFTWVRLHKKLRVARRNSKLLDFFSSSSSSSSCQTLCIKWTNLLIASACVFICLLHMTSTMRMKSEWLIAPWEARDEVTRQPAQWMQRHEWNESCESSNKTSDKVHSFHEMRVLCTLRKVKFTFRTHRGEH